MTDQAEALFDRYGRAFAAKGVNAKGKPYGIEICECSRCGGSGIIEAYRAIEGGVCFKCEGHPSRMRRPVQVTLYTQAQLDKLNAARAKRQVAKAAKAAAKAAEQAAAEAATKAARKAEVEADPTYQRLVSYAGENDFLADLAEKLFLGELSERQVEAAEQAIARIEAKRKLVAEAAWVGEVGERITFEGAVTAVRLIHQAEGYWDRDRWLTTIRLETGALLKWFGGKPGGDVGERVRGTASVGAHNEYQGVKETVIKNPRFKELAA